MWFCVELVPVDCSRIQGVEDTVNDRLWCNVFQFCLVVKDDSVVEDWFCDCDDVVKSHSWPSFEQCRRPCRFRDCDCGSWGGAESDAISDGFVCVWRVWMCGGYDSCDVVGDWSGQVDAIHCVEESIQLIFGDGPGRSGRFAASSLRDDLREHVCIDSCDIDLKEESVQLCFWNWVCSFQLDWVLGGEHEEWIWQWPCRALQCDGSFLHGLEHGGLCFWGCPVDFVRKYDIGENRSWLEDERPVSMLILLEDVSPKDVSGEEVRRELDSLEFQVHQESQALDQRGFADSRQSFQEDVSLAEDANDQEFMDFVLVEKDFVKFLKQFECDVLVFFELLWFDQHGWNCCLVFEVLVNGFSVPGLDCLALAFDWSLGRVQVARCVLLNGLCLLWFRGRFCNAHED